VSRAVRALLLVLSLFAGAAGYVGCAPKLAPALAPASYSVNADDDRFLEDFSRRTFTFFWEQADPRTGIIRDRSTTGGGPANEASANIGSIASVGFGLSGMCIAAERGW